MASDVFYLNDRSTRLAENIAFKAVKVLRDAGLENMIKKGDRVGIKVHMGEWGSVFSLRPHWISAIASEVKRLGGYPEVFDDNVVQGGARSSRSRTRDHLETAAVHGIHESTMGCPVVICDGEYGNEDVKCEVPHGVYLKYTYMGKGIEKYDKVIVLSHFKGHGMGVFGGALKNIGIGMASVRGKQITHFASHPEIGVMGAPINQEVVRTFLGKGPNNDIELLVKTCPGEAFELVNGQLIKDYSKCMLCGNCMMNVFRGIYFKHPKLMNMFPIAIVDSAAGIINKIGKENMIYLNYCMDVTPKCDCNEFQDRPMIPNFGVMASRDPVALEMACLEMAESMSVVPGSVAEEYGFGEPNTERFTNCSSASKVSQWEQINSAVYNGLGSSEYVLVRSEPVAAGKDLDFWFPRYSPDNTFQMANKQGYQSLPKGAFIPEQNCYNDYKNPDIPLENFSHVPSGKVGERRIDDNPTNE